MIGIIKTKYFLAIEYSNITESKVLQYLLDAQECLCNWEDDEDCIDCRYLHNLYYGVKNNPTPYPSLCITWTRGFSNQVIIEDISYLHSERLQDDLRIARKIIINKIKQLRFVKDKLAHNRNYYVVEGFDKVYIFASDKFISWLNLEIRNKFKIPQVYLFSAIRKLFSESFNKQFCKKD